MANLNLGYDPTEMPEPENNYEPVPAGEYLCTIEKAECKQAKNPNNWYLNVQFSVIGADYTNRKFFEIINFKNDNETAEKIAAQTLGQLVRATGISWKGESDDLIGANCYVSVKIKKDSEYGDKNEVKSHRPAQSTGVASSAPVPSSTPGTRKPPFFGGKK